MRTGTVAVLTIIGASGCTGGNPPDPASFGMPVATYLSNDLLSVGVDLTSDPSPRALRHLTDCAAAEAAILRGDNFLRHVRTSRVEEAGISRADAVYSVAKQIPAGSFVLDAEIVAENCRAEGTLGV